MTSKFKLRFNEDWGLEDTLDALVSRARQSNVPALVDLAAVFKDEVVSEEDHAYAIATLLTAFLQHNPSCLNLTHFTSDQEGHYDIDGVSFHRGGVVVASDASRKAS